MKAVIFDRDGVIVDSEEIHMRAVEGAFRKQGIELTPEQRRWVVGRSPLDYLDDYAKVFEFDRDRWNEDENELFVEGFKTVPLYDGIVDLIKAVRAAGAKTAITTSSNRSTTDMMIESHDLHGLFDVIVTVDDYTHRKPHPEPYLMTAERLGLEPSDCVVIEDSGSGLRSAVDAGMRCIVIPTEHSKDSDFSGAYRIVPSAVDLDADELLRA